MTNPPESRPPDASGGEQPDDLSAFLAEAEKALSDGSVDSLLPPAEPSHRRLRFHISDDRLEARLEGVFPGTTWQEVQQALAHERITFGIQEQAIRETLQRAEETGRLVRDVPAAKGRPAVYKKRKVVSYPFLEGLSDPERPNNPAPLHLASPVLHKVSDVLGQSDIENIRSYAHPVAAAARGDMLMKVEGEDVVEPGENVYGQPVKRVDSEGPAPTKPGEGVRLDASGSLLAERFGYVCTTGGKLSCIAPIWISPDRMAVYFFNPPHIGSRIAPDPPEVLDMIEEAGVTHGVDREAVEALCRDLAAGTTRESCIRVARGVRPDLKKGQIVFTFTLPPEARFEALRNAMSMSDLEAVVALDLEVGPVRPGQVIAEQSTANAGGGASGIDVFGAPVAADPASLETRKVYKPGPNVQRTAEEGRVLYTADIFGYAGVLDNRITVVSPVWISPDKMQACFVLFPQAGRPVLPTIEEIEGLLEHAHVAHGIDKAAVAGLWKDPPDPSGPAHRAVTLARGTKPLEGSHGVVELLFKSEPDPGKLMESGRMDFRERDAVPQAGPGDLLAKRSLPRPGKPGMDVRGRKIPPPGATRGLLYAGPNVAMEVEDGIQRFTATDAGWPRVIKDTLGVMQRFRHPGDVDYKTGNITMEGDVEIGGSVKRRFKIKAGGNVIVGGALERGSEVEAEGNVAVERGIVGARVRAGGDLHARFIHDSDVAAGNDLLVRNYISDTQARVRHRAVVQGNAGGDRDLCLLGGDLVAGFEADVVSVGAAYGRKTRVLAGFDVELEQQLEKYRKGQAFADLRSRKAMRGVQAVIGQNETSGMAAAIQRLSPSRRTFVAKHLKELETMRSLKESLEHHIREMEERRRDIAGRARIRVKGTAYPKSVLQVAAACKNVEQPIQRMAFRLNPEQTAVVQSPMDEG